MKGIILAGGSGTRLYPITQGISKQLMPIYEKPMIYYPISTLMQAGIQDILIITTPEDQSAFQRLLGDGSQRGIQISYAIQPSPDGLAQAFIIGEDFIGDDSVCMILGDNLFYGHGLEDLLIGAKNTVETQNRSVVFGYQVSDPERYGVVEFGPDMSAISIAEKPQNPKSNYAVVGIYFYTNDVVNVAKSIKPSDRGELEITSINEYYLSQNKLSVEVMGSGYARLDTGTYESMMQASSFVQIVQQRQGIKIGCPEEIAYTKGWITTEQLQTIADKMSKNEYGQYLKGLLR